ncbi:uncharacterized protein FSUBG_11687 [Fusarium subglutinans]|uniref:NB-ARC domain-containing protein n=1 Tax=Gibberella subglutinans TaxID=42677 RepID=A0A8H5LBR6_GIBSU|nr:uncharacterized protein FSUBG_11687 [Fusarium subglutinans]KAF5587786.1 hypothetical protein FSUBG_11687 [Fusarium subglutinans]
MEKSALSSAEDEKRPGPSTKHSDSSTVVDGLDSESSTKLVVPSETVWDELFPQKKAEIASVIQEVHQKLWSTRLSNLKGGVTGRQPKEKIMSIDEALDRVTNTESFVKEVSAFLKHFSKEKEKDPNWFQRQLSRLRRGVERKNEFQNGISSAVQIDPTGIACLSWGLLLIAIQYSCVYAESSDMFDRVLNTLSGVHDNFESLEVDVKAYSSAPELRTLLFRLFDGYIKLCLAAIKYSTNLAPGFHQSRVSRKPEAEMNALKDMIIKTTQMFDRKTTQVSRAVAMNTGHTVLAKMNEQALTASEYHERSMAATEGQTSTLLTALARLQPSGPEPIEEFQLPVDTLTMPRNTNFTGRDKFISQLHSFLVSGNQNVNKPASCCLLGIGGMGKTETALEFAFKYQQHWTAGIFWVAADHNQEMELLRTYNEIGLSLGIVSSEEFDDRNLGKVKNWLQKTDKRWLIIFDSFTPSGEGIDWRRNMERIWPSKTKAAGCSIIVTSQTELPSKYVEKTIPMEPLGGDEGLQLLLPDEELKQLKESDRDVALEIVNELGGSPLFLNLAREFRGDTIPLQSYLDQIRGDSNLPLAKSHADEIDKDWRYSKAAFKAIDLSLPHVGTGLRDLLDELAFMYDEDISEFILNSQLSAHPETNRQYLENVHMLVKAGLVKVNAEVSHGKKAHRSLRIHRAIQVALLIQLNSDVGRREAALKRVTGHLRASYPEPSPMQIPSALASNTLRLVLPHVLSMVRCYERAFPKPRGDLQLARLIIGFGGMDCYDRGLIRESYDLNNSAKMVLESLEKVERLEIIDPYWSDALTVQGLCTDFMGLNTRGEGLDVRTKCMEIRKRHFRSIPGRKLQHENEIRLYNCYTDLSCSYQQTNEFGLVKDLVNQCYQKYLEWGTEEEGPYEYSKYYSQLSHVLIYEGRNDEAIEYAERACHLAELSSPETNHPWLYKFQHANIMWRHGDRKKEAFELMKSLIKAHSQGLSVSYSEVLNLGMEQNLGIMAYYLGELDMADPNHQWHYLSSQKPHEVTLLKIFDSDVNARTRFSLHSSFRLGYADQSRESFEIRALVFDKAA